MRICSAVVLGAVLLSGCTPSTSEQAGPEGEPGPTSTDTRFAIPVPDAPPPSNEPTLREAERFARYFLTEEVGYLVNSGFPTHFLRATATACEECRDFSDEVASWHEKGPVTMAPVHAKQVDSRPSDSGTALGPYFLAFETAVPPVYRGDDVVEPGFEGRQLLAVEAWRGDWYVVRWERL